MNDDLAINTQKLNSYLKQKSQNQLQLQQLFGYFNSNNKIERCKQREKPQMKENQNNYQFEDQNKLYEGCYFQQNLNYYQQSQKQQQLSERLISSSQPIQYFSEKFKQLHFKKVQEAQDTNYKNQQNIKNRISLNALVSNKKTYKEKKSFSDTRSLTNYSSPNLSINKFSLKNKSQKQQNDKPKDQIIYLNPFNSIIFQTINTKKFQKIYKYNYKQLLEKFQILHKKMLIDGQKNFFKSKQNQQQINIALSLTGLKSSQKLGKAKTFRQFKAICNYLKLNNPQNESLKSQLKRGFQLIDQAYINQFRNLMGFKSQDNNPNLSNQFSNKGNLFQFGFSASKKNKL